MSNEDKPLPRPPKTPFGFNKHIDREENPPLMADRIAAAMAEGRMEEFLQREVPDNEQARALVSLMMGMTGMMMPGTPQGQEQIEPVETNPVFQKSAASSGVEVPEEVYKAVQSSDVAQLMEILKKEHQKRTQNSDTGNADMPASAELHSHIEETASAEKEILNHLIKIAADNSVTIDWLIQRALKLYVEEYQKTGRL